MLCKRATNDALPARVAASRNDDIVCAIDARVSVESRAPTTEPECRRRRRRCTRRPRAPQTAPTGPWRSCDGASNRASNPATPSRNDGPKDRLVAQRIGVARQRPGRRRGPTRRRGARHQVDVDGVERRQRECAERRRCERAQPRRRQLLAVGAPVDRRRQRQRHRRLCRVSASDNEKDDARAYITCAHDVVHADDGERDGKLRQRAPKGGVVARRCSTRA